MKTQKLSCLLALMAGFLLIVMLSGCAALKLGRDTKPAPVTDIDGNVYRTVRIGGRVWTAENLKTTRYNDGSESQNVTNEGATNEAGFSALPGGGRDASDGFANIMFSGYWWFSGKVSSTSDRDRSMNRYWFSKQVGFSVRCFRVIDN